MCFLAGYSAFHVATPVASRVDFSMNNKIKTFIQNKLGSLLRPDSLLLYKTVKEEMRL